MLFQNNIQKRSLTVPALLPIPCVLHKKSGYLYSTVSLSLVLLYHYRWYNSLIVVGITVPLSLVQQSHRRWYYCTIIVGIAVSWPATQ